MGSEWVLDLMLNKGFCVRSGDVLIHSVKRLSDSEIFSVGDKTTRGIIHGFEIKDWFLSVSVGDQKTLLRTFDKVKERKPLFTTEQILELKEIIKNTLDEIRPTFGYKD